MRSVKKKEAQIRGSTENPQDRKGSSPKCTTGQIKGPSILLVKPAM